jgi:hypothetical protein
LPSLKTVPAASEELAATGTDGREERATDPVTDENSDERNILSIKTLASNERRSHNPQVRRSSRLPGNSDSIRKRPLTCAKPLLF